MRRLAERLRAAGLRQDNFGCRISDFGFPLEAALSPATLGSDWVGLERSTVLFRDPANSGRCFVSRLRAAADLAMSP